ncbi:MAG TPA: hypothetical protein VIQ80_02310 [Candidatus Saccharimonadales bacterium]
MNRRTITLLIITGIVAIALIIGGVLFQYYASFHKVTIEIKRPELTVDIYRANPNAEEMDATSGTKITTTSETKTLSLQADKYYVLPQGDKYDNSAIPFTIKDKDATISVNPGFSNTYLTSLLQQELSTVKSVMLTKYPFITTGFKLNDGKLYEDGTWYGTTLIQNADPGSNGDVYRTVLHKVNGTWQFVATPAIIISTLDHKDIPETVLNDLNRQSGY